jgi:Sec-independent protein secretion pathway component TatC
MPIGLILYAVTAILVGWYGRNRRIGFLGCFLFALLLTPPLFFLMLIITAPKPPVIEVPIPPQNNPAD